MWPYDRPRSTFYFYCIIAVAIIGMTILSVFVPRLDISPANYPYHVSIQLDGKHHCSGSLISENHVLTTAHCVDKFIVDRIPVSRIKVAVGTTKLPGGTIYDTDIITPHGSYNPNILKNDVAVIKLKQKVTESENVGIIQLEQKLMIQYGQKLDASAFNFDSERKSWDFERFTRYIVHNNTCEEYFSKEMLPGKFCAVIHNQHDLRRDSGSPATINKKCLIGIFSIPSTRISHRLGVPDILTHVPSYLKFIKKEMSRTN